MVNDLACSAPAVNLVLRWVVIVYVLCFIMFCEWSREERAFSLLGRKADFLLFSMYTRTHFLNSSVVVCGTFITN